MADQTKQVIDGNLLASDMEGGLLLLSYATQSGMAVDVDTAKAIARSKALFATDQLAGDDLAAFYMALQTLSAAAAPVTVAGLRAAMSTGATGMTLAGLGRTSLPESRKAIRWYWLWTVFWLLILVAVQVYWVIGSTALNSLKQANEEKNKARVEQDVARSKLPKGTSLEQTPEGKRMIEAVDTLRNRADAYVEILSKWNQFLRFGLPRHSDADAADDGAKAAKKDEDPVRATDVMLARTPFVLFSLQAYVLPLLYGLLGACTYVLRMLSRDVRAFSYTPESHIRYKIRLVLGTLSGLAITWFFEPGSETLKSLSPLALAFLAGYSVEILFAAMDRFVMAFSATGRDDSQTGSARATASAQHKE